VTCSIFSRPGRACAAGETPQSNCQPATPEAESVAAVQALPFRRYSAVDALETLIRHPAAACFSNRGSCSRARPHSPTRAVRQSHDWLRRLKQPVQPLTNTPTIHLCRSDAQDINPIYRTGASRLTNYVFQNYPL